MLLQECGDLFLFTEFNSWLWQFYVSSRERITFREIYDVHFIRA